MTEATQKTPIEQVRDRLNSGQTMLAGGAYRQYKLTKKNLGQITEAKGGFNIQNGKSKVFVFFYQCKFYS
jgi:hypothetical protein